MSPHVPCGKYHKLQVRLTLRLCLLPELSLPLFLNTSLLSSHTQFTTLKPFGIQHSLTRTLATTSFPEISTALLDYHNQAIHHG